MSLPPALLRWAVVDRRRLESARALHRREKKLHNRYLHGWGVACGLEVLCNPCKGFVTVTPGYALSPCGDDIVVCREEAVNVCDLVKQCRDQRQWDCDPAWPQPQPDCDQDQPWVLYICYDEKPSRGITALRGGSGAACCSRCSCGGSSSCGCGCHGKSASQTKNSYQSKQSRALPQCEPTVTCEGYTFQIRKLPPRTRGLDLGKMINGITTCVRELAELKQALEVSASAMTLSKANAIREELVSFLERHEIANCDLYRGVLQPLLGLPMTQTGNVDVDTVVVDVDTVVNDFFSLYRAALQECICLALLPPCPEPVEDNCVPLATVTVNCKSGCRIIRVCNWEHRRIVPTVPGLQYWFEPFLRKSGLPEALARFCCATEEGDQAAIHKLLGAAGSTAVFDQLQDLFKRFIQT